MQAKRLSVGALEAAVLNVLWDRGPSTVAEVADALPPGRERHHNTCATVLTRLVRRRLVARTPSGRTHTYRALVTRDALGRRVLASIRRDLFGGSLRSLVAALVGPKGGKGDDAAALRALLAEIEKDETENDGARRGR